MKYNLILTACVVLAIVFGYLGKTYEVQLNPPELKIVYQCYQLRESEW